MDCSIFTLSFQCFLSTHIYLFSILPTYSSFFVCAKMPLEEAPLKGKWRLNMSRLRLCNQYVFEQMGLSIDGGWSKSVVLAVLWRRTCRDNTHAASVNASLHLARYPLCVSLCVNFWLLIETTLTCLIWRSLVKRANEDISQSKKKSIWVSFPLLSLELLFLLAQCLLVAVSTPFIESNHSTVATQTHTHTHKGLAHQEAASC